MVVQDPPVALPSKRPPQGSDDRCPWCDQPINHQKFVEITSQIAIQERERAAVAERRLRDELANQKAAIEARAVASIAAAQKANTAALEAAARAATAREAEARKSERKAAQATIATAEAARKAADRQVKGLHAEQNKTMTRRLDEQRAALDKAAKAALAVEHDRSFKKNQKLATKVDALQRQLDEQRANTLGEGAGIDLAEELKKAFPGDRVRATGTSDQGANIVHEVVEHGRLCGRLVYDARSRRAWRDGFIAKLRKDQLAAEADHAIIATQMLPKGASQIHLQDRVIVANPARVVVLVEMLRRHIVQMDALRLSIEARAEKTARLYEFITTDRYGQLIDEIDKQAEALEELDVEEHKAHSTTWQKRGQLIKSIQKAQGVIESAIDDIIGTARAGDKA